MLRGKKLGEAFIDVSKYSITVGVIGSLLSERATIDTPAGLSIVAILSAVVGWFILPKEEDKE